MIILMGRMAMLVRINNYEIYHLVDYGFDDEDDACV